MMSYILGNFWYHYDIVKRLLIRSGIISAPRICFFGYDTMNILTMARTIDRGQYTEVTKAEMDSSLSKIFDKVRVEINDVILDACYFCSPAYHLLAYDALYQFPGIVYVVDICESLITRSIRELQIMVDDEELKQPILILFSPPTGDRNVENVIRDYNLTDIIDKGNGRIALFTYTLSPTELSGYMEGVDWLIKKLNL